MERSHCVVFCSWLPLLPSNLKEFAGVFLRRDPESTVLLASELAHNTETTNDILIKNGHGQALVRC